MTTSTADRLLDVAERLFAQRGIDAVSLREINAASGSRNASAVQYHFGNREGLLRAVIARHVDVVNDRRTAMVAALEVADRAPTIPDVVAAFLQPLGDELATPSGRSYLRILAQLTAADVEWAVRVSELGENAGFLRAGELLDSLLVDLPSQVRGQRRHQAFRFALRALGDQARWDVRPHDDAVFLANLADMLVGALTAPVSADTRRALG
jgi:AcrR family transcriptional regulator